MSSPFCIECLAIERRSGCTETGLGIAQFFQRQNICAPTHAPNTIPAVHHPIPLEYFPMLPTVPVSHSLKTRITLLTVFIFLTGTWALSIYATHTLQRDMEHLLGEQHFSTIKQVAAEIDSEIRERIHALEVTTEIMDAAWIDRPSTVQKFIDGRPLLKSLFNDGIMVYHKDGTAIAASPLVKERIGLNFMDRDYLIGAIREGKATISRPIIGRTGHSPSIVMAVPLRNAQGQIIGALAGVTRLNKPSFLNRISETRFGTSGGYLLVDRNSRMIVTATDKHRTMEATPDPGISPMIDRFHRGFEGYAVYVNPHVQEVLASVSGIPVANWHAAINLPTDEAFAPSRRMQQRMLLATLLLSLVACGLTWWILRRQLSPMLDTALSLSMTPESQQLPEALPVARQDEIGVMIGSFNHLLEKLRKREIELHTSEEQFRLIFEQSKDAIIFGYPDGRIISAHPEACRLLGYSEEEFRQLGRQGIADMTDPELISAFAKRSETGRFFGEVPCWHRDKGKFAAEFDSSLYTDAQGQMRTINRIRDIRERKRAELALIDSERRFRTLTENMPDNVVRYDHECRERYRNAAALRFFGHYGPHWYGRTPTELIPGVHEIVEYESRIRQTLATGESSSIECHIVVGPHRGQAHLISFVAERDESGKIVGAITIGQDITSIKTTERQIIESRDLLRQLAVRYDSAREEERKRIAREIHDELGQMLTAQRLNIDTLKRQFGNANPTLMARCNSMLELTDKTIQVVRSIVNLMRPAALNMGIAAALEWLASELYSRTGVDCRVHLDENGIDLDEEKTVAVFRIVQESLTNVARHAKAQCVELFFARKGTHYSLFIRDDGVGFDPEKVPEKHLGLVGIHERALMIGGKACIVSAPGSGTGIRVTFPHKQEQGEQP